MPEHFLISISSQLREHLRALRKRRGLTQAQLGERIGVSQARIAEIEANPGVVNLDQLQQLLASLGASLCLHTDSAEAPSHPHPPQVAEKAAPAYPRHGDSQAADKKRGSW
ncbi:helix-turn-helix domain-containing protein [Herbaspirillum robiniae]|uniref:helix-turn-helix domain-containing protein n=1 Tax=Herbaspirillum robiniae TaxID=2014887 RepID=UPI003D7790DF